MDWGLGGQNPVAGLVGVESVGDGMERDIDDDADSPGEPATDPPGNDDRADHAPTGHHDQKDTNRRSNVTADDHGLASHESTRTPRTGDRVNGGGVIRTNNATSLRLHCSPTVEALVQAGRAFGC